MEFPKRGMQVGKNITKGLFLLKEHQTCFIFSGHLCLLNLTQKGVLKYIKLVKGINFDSKVKIMPPFLFINTPLTPMGIP